MVRFLAPTALMLSVLFQATFGQVHQDLVFITSHRPMIPTEAPHVTKPDLHQTQEVKAGLILMIRGYQLFLSSQQSDKICVFTPGCSRFGMAAIQKYGAFYGMLLASDRLQRCHGWGHKDLPIHPQTLKFIDPLENYQPRRAKHWDRLDQ